MIRAHDPIRWRDDRLLALPQPWARRALKGHDKRGGVWSREANSWLLDMAERMEGLRIPIDADDAEICALAEKCAREAMNLADGPVPLTVTGYRERLARYCAGYGINQPPVTVTDTGAIRRMTNAIWWRRKLRTEQGRLLEGEAIRLGLVHRKGEIYASNATIQRRQKQKQRNAKTLESTEAVNLTTGEIYNLSQLVEKCNSNPRIRRGELMTRIGGFEVVAKGCGHVAEFVTLTTPSKFHPKKTTASGHVIDNPKFNGSTPKQASQYLGKVWSLCRSALARYGVRIYGFRIAEPHHDGTPHWHCLFFMPEWFSKGRRMVPRFRAIVRRYFLRMDASEAGAKKRRVEFEAIDWAKGSAVGYIAKYVSKNIDGYQVQEDFEAGKDAIVTAPRVEAWASTWGIRQFQQIGGAPVGVWRELRRMEVADDQSKTLQQAITAADTGGINRAPGSRPEGAGVYWAEYTRIQGGAMVERKNLRLRAAYTDKGSKWDATQWAQVEARNCYEEPAAATCYGVRDVLAYRVHVSRIYSWEIRRGKSGSTGVLGVGVAPVSSAPWTGVNNCTQGIENDFYREGDGPEIPRGEAKILANTGGGAGINRDHQASRVAHLRYGSENRIRQ